MSDSIVLADTDDLFTISDRLLRAKTILETYIGSLNKEDRADDC